MNFNDQESAFDEKYERALLQSKQLLKDRNQTLELIAKANRIDCKLASRLKNKEISKIENGYVNNSNGFKLELVHSVNDVKEVKKITSMPKPKTISIKIKPEYKVKQYEPIDRNAYSSKNKAFLCFYIVAISCSIASYFIK
jgi:hypothetical protein